MFSKEILACEAPHRMDHQSGIPLNEQIKRPRPAYLFANTAGSKPSFRRHYDRDFRPDDRYLRDLPDMTETVGGIDGSDVAIQQVGVSGFRMPLQVATRDGGQRELEARITGTVSLEAGNKGINMSRILRSFYSHRSEVFDLHTLSRILETYLREVGTLQARLKVQMSYPMLLKSLRSGMEGFQYYSVAFVGWLEAGGRLRRFLELDFVYSSACPCSAELAEHARETRGAYAIPHSQRSKARIKVEVKPGTDLHIEELVEMARQALQTETQVLVKREDEQAFAEMNGAYVKFVEDAARLVHQVLDREPRICDFQAACSHLESLHSHDAVSVICKGVPGGFRADFMEFSELVC